MRLFISNSEGHILSIPFSASEEQVLFALFAEDIRAFVGNRNSKLSFLVLDDERYYIHKGTIWVNRTVGQEPFKIKYEY